MTLLEKTQTYWEISLNWHGKVVKSKLTTGGALRSLGSILNWTGPKRKLVTHVNSLQYQIILGDKNAK